MAGVPSADEGLVSDAPGLVPVSTEFSVPLRIRPRREDRLLSLHVKGKESETCTIIATHSHIKSNIV